MTVLSDSAIAHLQAIVDCPEPPGNRYAIVKRIGAGGMGTVFHARDELLARDVALKVCPLAHDQDLDTLIAEARVLAALEHPGIVPVHDAGRLPDGRAFYVMSLLEGETLAAHLRRVPELASRLRLFERLCDTMSFAHANGIVHRDLTPANVMVGRFGEVRVVDWGLAARAGDAALAGGTTGYMAPEQMRGLADRRVDIYSLGAVLREIAQDCSPSRRYPRAPLASIVSRATAQDPRDRYSSVSDLAADVRCYLDGQAVTAHRETPAERVRRFGRTYKTPLTIVAAYLLMRILLLLWR